MGGLGAASVGWHAACHFHRLRDRRPPGGRRGGASRRATRRGAGPSAIPASCGGREAPRRGHPAGGTQRATSPGTPGPGTRNRRARPEIERSAMLVADRRVARSVPPPRRTRVGHGPTDQAPPRLICGGRAETSGRWHAACHLPGCTGVGNGSRALRRDCGGPRRWRRTRLVCSPGSTRARPPVPRSSAVPLVLPSRGMDLPLFRPLFRDGHGGDPS